MKTILHYLLLPLLIFVSAETLAQRTCATYENYQNQLLTNPVFAKNQKDIETFTRNYIKKGGSRALNNIAGRGASVYTIPVVVHVVFKTSAQNISDAQVQSQIDVLNNDYQLLNSDTALVPEAFKPVMADCKIQFCLAKQDANGSATTGIVRKQTTKTSFSNSDDGVKFNSKGGDNAWPANKYLNLWVCNLASPLLGYAQFPGGSAATDGVVILYSAFGNTGSVAAPYNKGRTATHEVGHWFNLRHIWGDDGGACGNAGDFIDDTPDQAKENYGCPAYPHVSCSNGPNGDMFMNYMDYVDDRCMQMFSIGQRDRMYAILQPGGARAAITTSQGCTEVSGTTCGTPSGLSAANITFNSATISWSLVAGANSYDVQYKNSADTSFTTVADLTSVSYNLSGLTASASYNCQVKANCSSANSNYSATQSFTTQDVGCTDNYEPNNTKNSAAAIPVDTDVKGLISTGTDNDYFSFSNTSAAKNIKITLTNLPADYDMKLLNTSGKRAGVSNNSGTANETIVYNNGAAGGYKVIVFGYGGANSTTQCYTLKISISGTAFREEAARVITVKNGVAIYPQPASSFTNIQFNNEWKGIVTIRVINQLGAVVSTSQVNTDNKTYRLNTSNLKSGMYYINIYNGRQFVTHKILVQR